MTAIAKLTDRFSEADIDHEIVIMRLDSGEFYALSETGAAIWRLIDGKRDQAAIVAALAQDFDANDGDIASDVEAFLEHLTGAGLLGRA